MATGISPGGRPIDTSPLDKSKKSNWVEKVGGLPPYIRGVARGIADGKPVTSRHIAIAISRMKVWAAGGDNVTPKVRAAAAAALAEWEAKKAASHSLANSGDNDIELDWTAFNQNRKNQQQPRQQAAGVIPGYTGPPLPQNIIDKITQFQKDNGLPVTGDLDSATVTYASAHTEKIAGGSSGSGGGGASSGADNAKKAADKAKADADKKAKADAKAKATAEKKKVAAAKKAKAAKVAAAKKKAAAVKKAAAAKVSAEKKKAAATKKATGKKITAEIGRLTVLKTQVSNGRIEGGSEGASNASKADKAARIAEINVAIAKWRAKKADLSNERGGQDFELAAVGGQHVPGTAYHWRHEWHPLDVRTALHYRKKKAARELHAKGAPHFNPEPDEGKFVEGVKPIKGGLSISEKPKAPPAPDPTPEPESNEARIKRLIAGLPKETRNKRELWGEGALEILAELGDEKSEAHLRARKEIERVHGKPGERYSGEQLADLEKRTVSRIMREKAKIDKIKKERAERQALRDRHDPEGIRKLEDELYDKYGHTRKFEMDDDDLDRLIALGDPGAKHAKEYKVERVKKAEAYEKAKAEARERVEGKNQEGDPVSKALVNKTTGATKVGVQEAMDAIDKVHHDGELVPIVVKQSASGKFYGQYSRTLGSGAGDAIHISKGKTDNANSQHYAATMTHEVGHWLDARVLGADGSGRMFKSEQAAHSWSTGVTAEPGTPDAEWQRWWSEIENSDSIKQLKGHKSFGGTVGRSTYKGYATTPREIWARSYAQYIATRSGNKNMQQQIADIAALRNVSTSQNIAGYSQWTPEEFEPIATAIDGILRQKGWLK